MRLCKYLLQVLGNPAGFRVSISQHARASLLIPLLSKADQIAQHLIKCQFPSIWRGENWSVLAEAWGKDVSCIRLGGV